MLILGIILIIAGALVLAYLGPEPIVRLAGALLVLVGIVLVLFGIFDVADVHVADDGESLPLRSSWGVMRAFLVR